VRAIECLVPGFPRPFHVRAVPNWCSLLFPVFLVVECLELLRTSERSFVTLLQQLGFGHLESVKICRGALVLDPGPTVV
jgi:hypothetical protein